MSNVKLIKTSYSTSSDRDVSKASDESDDDFDFDELTDEVSSSTASVVIPTSGTPCMLPTDVMRASAYTKDEPEEDKLRTDEDLHSECPLCKMTDESFAEVPPAIADFRTAMRVQTATIPDENAYSLLAKMFNITLRGTNKDVPTMTTRRIEIHFRAMRHIVGEETRTTSTIIRFIVELMDELKDNGVLLKDAAGKISIQPDGFNQYLRLVDHYKHLVELRSKRSKEYTSLTGVVKQKHVAPNFNSRRPNRMTNRLT